MLTHESVPGSTVWMDLVYRLNGLNSCMNLMREVSPTRSSWGRGIFVLPSWLVVLSPSSSSCARGQIMPP